MIHQTLEKVGGIAVPRAREGRKGLSTPGALAAVRRGLEPAGEKFRGTPRHPKVRGGWGYHRHSSPSSFSTFFEIGESLT